MSTLSLTEVDVTAGLTVTSFSRRLLVGLGVQPQSCVPLSVHVDDTSQALFSRSQTLPTYSLPMLAGMVWLCEISQAPVALAWPLTST